MLYSITVFKEMGRKRKRIYAVEIQARDAINALEQACIPLITGRIVEIRMIENPGIETHFERPPIRKPAGDGV
jgi:hypothetical protein